MNGFQFNIRIFMDAGLPKDFSVPWFISHRTTLHRHKATLSCCWYQTYISKTSITLSCSKKVKVQMILYIVYVLQLWRNIVHTTDNSEKTAVGQKEIRITRVMTFKVTIKIHHESDFQSSLITGSKIMKVWDLSLLTLDFHIGY